MDGVRRKRCETCADHVAGPTPCTGICRNLIWQPKSDAARFVRDRELACYGGWGVDHWRPKPDTFPSNGSGGAVPGAGGGGTAVTYGSLYGATSGSDDAMIRLIPVELLAVFQAQLDSEPSFGLEPDPDPRT